MRNPVAPLLGLCALACSASAAPVTWTTGPTTTVDESSISTTGTLISAGHWGTDTVGVNANGEFISFVRARHGRPPEALEFAACLGWAEYGDGNIFQPPGAVDPGFDQVMDGFGYGGTSCGVTVSHLIPGATYQIQLFASDDRDCCHTRTQKWSDSATNGVGHETATYVMDTSPYVIGQFVADSTGTQTVYALGVPSDNDSSGNVDGVNAYVLRMTNLPNPNADIDNDGLTNQQEIDAGTDPTNPDTDGDGIKDGDEVNGGITDWLVADSDGDGFGDGAEVAYGTLPNDASSTPAGYDSMTWGTPQNITGKLTDFAVNGTRVVAWSGGDHAITINGITDGGAPLTFVRGPLIDDRYTGFDPLNRNQDADYESLLDGGTYSGSTRAIVFNNLTVGHNYQLQIWYSDTRDCCQGRAGSYGTDPTTPAVNLFQGSAYNASGPVVPAQYVIATFTAQHASEAVYSGYSVGAQYNALMLRDVTGVTPASDLLITSSKFNGAAFEVIVSGLTTGKNYKLVRSTDLVTFSDVSGGAFTASAATKTVSDATPPTGKAFYRVVLVP